MEELVVVRDEAMGEGGGLEGVVVDAAYLAKLTKAPGRNVEEE